MYRRENKIHRMYWISHERKRKQKIPFLPTKLMVDYQLALKSITKLTKVLSITKGIDQLIQLGEHMIWSLAKICANKPNPLGSKAVKPFDFLKCPIETVFVINPNKAQNKTKSWCKPQRYFININIKIDKYSYNTY